MSHLEEENEKTEKRQRLSNNVKLSTQLACISELPDSIISHTLLHLPAKDAARTIFLSKDWSRIWHSHLVRDFGAFVDWLEKEKMFYFCKIPCDLTISPRHDLNTFWFIQHGKYSKKSSHVDLRIIINNNASCQMHEIINQSGRRCFSGLVELRMNCLRRLSNFEGLIDRLLGSCAPDLITIRDVKGAEDSLLKFFYRELGKTCDKERLSCCRDHHGSKCWRHYVTIVNMSHIPEDALLKATLRWQSEF